MNEWLFFYILMACFASYESIYTLAFKNQADAENAERLDHLFGARDDHKLLAITYRTTVIPALAVCAAVCWVYAIFILLEVSKIGI